MFLDLRRVEENARQAATEDLLDRVTVFRTGMEPEAIDIIETELRRRRVSPRQIEAHEARRRQETSPLPDGTVVRCDFCHRPAVAEDRGWRKLFGLVPLFPRRYHYCEEHLPRR